MITALGADYSWARPGGAALKAAGVTAVGRYLASDGRGITASEYQDLKDHGIGVWLVREGSASGMLSGFAQGAADARVAVGQIAAAGLPADSLVYAAADWDVSSGQFAACDDYMRGFASVLGVNRTGIYGGLHYLNHAHQAGLAVGFWQAGATSWNHGEAAQMPLHFVQTTNTPPVPGSDHNYIYSTATLAGSGTATPITLESLMALKDSIQFFTNPKRGVFLAGPAAWLPIDNRDGIDGQHKIDVLLKHVGAIPTTVVPDVADWDVLNQTFKDWALASTTGR